MAKLRLNWTKTHPKFHPGNRANDAHKIELSAMKKGDRTPRTPRRWYCKWCKNDKFNTEHALQLHLETSFCSKLRANAARRGQRRNSPGISSGSDSFSGDDADENFDSMEWNTSPDTPKKPVIPRFEIEGVDHEEIGHVVIQMGELLDETGSDDESSAYSGTYRHIGEEANPMGTETKAEDYSDEDYEEESVGEGTESHPMDMKPPHPPDSGANSDIMVGPDQWIQGQFQEYCAFARKTFIAFSPDEIRSIKLLHLLKEKNAPMNAYEATTLWHLKQARFLREHETLSDYQGHIGRKTIMKTLIRRYNFENKLPFQKTIRLPSSGTVARITCHDAKATLQRLLTDPRIKAEDYLFFGGDPLAPPPEDRATIADLNTGDAFYHTYHALVQGDGEQIMPIVLYCDGTAVSHFHDMEIIQVNIALGIMTREARTKPYCWAPLGYIEKVHEHGGRGSAILEEANHLETQDGDHSVDSTETVIEATAVGEGAIQDFHAMMAVILEEFLDVQARGFLFDEWNLAKQTLTRDIHYQTFVPFVRADTKEADMFCGKYGQRLTTQQICRKCHIPLATCDDHLASYRLKTVLEVQKLVEKGDLEGLKAISQTYLTNAFHEVRFSMGNNRGIHGSCPSEMLHAFLLGTFKYLRDIFFEYIGKDSEGARIINALSKVYSKFFARQSDRTMPGAAFTKGIQVGKLMGKDYRGVLLIILAMLRSTKGQSVLRRHKNFKLESSLMDWILLVETMLTWESYLNEPLMERAHVKRLEKKHRYIMYLMRKIAQRNKGMGLKLAKFHMILHLWEDIMEFGVPLETDTSANESMHKPSKKASKMTQKAADTFNFQTAMRLVEFTLLDLAMEEITTGNVPWQYYTKRPGKSKKDSVAVADTEATSEPDTSTGDLKIVVFEQENGEPGFRVVTRSKFRSKMKLNKDLLDFLIGLQDEVQDHISTESLPIFTVHKRAGQTFRGHPNFRGKGPWRDWVWVDWGAPYGEMPCHIWCFVVLQGMPTGRNRLRYGDIGLADGVYAVVENSTVEKLDEDGYDECGVKSEMMEAIRKDIELDADGCPVKRTFYLADTEAFVDPCCVIPDIGGPNNRYFVVQPRNSWAELFLKWVDAPHTLDQMDPLDEVDVDEKVIAKLDEEESK